MSAEGDWGMAGNFHVIAGDTNTASDPRLGDPGSFVYLASWALSICSRPLAFTEGFLRYPRPPQLMEQ